MQLFAFELGSQKKGLEKALKYRSENEKKKPGLKRLSFLYGGYECKAFNFEIFETMRRLVLTGGLKMLKPGTSEQIFLAMIICLGTQRLHSGKNPFVRPTTGLMSEMLQWQLVAAVFTALAIRVREIGGAPMEELEESAWDKTLLSCQLLMPVVLIAYKVFGFGYGAYSYELSDDDFEDDPENNDSKGLGRPSNIGGGEEDKFDVEAGTLKNPLTRSGSTRILHNGVVKKVRRRDV